MSGLEDPDPKRARSLRLLKDWETNEGLHIFSEVTEEIKKYIYLIYFFNV
jgi:hypothetical protein